MNQGHEIFSETSYLIDSNLNWFFEESKKTKWSLEENKRIENALALYDVDTPDRWYKVASMIPGKTVIDVIKKYKELEEDVSDIEAGLIPVTSPTCDSFTLDRMNHQSLNGMKEIHVTGGKQSTLTRPSDQERKNGVAWTEEEHRQFLLGLEKYGKGDWRNISRNFVISRTPTQVASHAQKYIIRQISGGKDKRRSSIHDTTTVNLIDAKSALINREIVEIEDEPLLLDHSHQLPVDEDAVHCKGIIFGAEKENSSICTGEASEWKKPGKDISYEILSEHFGKPLSDAAESFHVSRSTFKRMCRDHGITRWNSSKRRMGNDIYSKNRTVNDDKPSMSSSLMVIPPLQDTAVVTLPQTSQEMNKINVKATYKGTAIRFELPDSSGITELEDMVIERLKLKRHTFSIKYQDDEGDWVLIACDNDVQKCIEISRSLKNTITKMLVDPPIGC